MLRELIISLQQYAEQHKSIERESFLDEFLWLDPSPGVYSQQRRFDEGA